MEFRRGPNRIFSIDTMLMMIIYAIWNPRNENKTWKTYHKEWTQPRKPKMTSKFNWQMYLINSFQFFI